MTIKKLLQIHIAKETIVYVFETDQSWQDEKVYIIKTLNVCTHKAYYRYGNHIQALSILNTYRKDKVFEL